MPLNIIILFSKPKIFEMKFLFHSIAKKVLFPHFSAALVATNQAQCLKPQSSLPP